MRVVLPQAHQRRGDQPPEGAPLHRPVRQAEGDRPAAAGGGERRLDWTLSLSLCCVASVFAFGFTFCFLFFLFALVLFSFFLSFDTFGLFCSVILCSVSLCLFGFGPPGSTPPPPALQLEAQEEKLRLEEEARNAAQRQAARLARERKVKEVRRPTEPYLQRLCSHWPQKKRPLLL